MNFLAFNTMRAMGVPFEDMGLYFKGGGSQKQSSTTVSTPHQQGNFDKLLGGADSWLNNGGYDKNFGGSADFNPVAGQTDAQKAGLGGMTNLGGNLQGLLNGAGIDFLG
ncbi:putative particle protein [Pseudomonas phage NV1]|uniref:Putative particle protein n=1 Tax=Pseudomonas phage NV1 TaxID=2079543 RepID=A0A2L0HPN8_9CAUD|nr:putative particle protein [Pseudomonas phage NV1]AUX83678.1 putative particle protein [Pseudomonas phage NV1]